MRNAKFGSRLLQTLLASVMLALVAPAEGYAQGVTTAAISGTVTGQAGNPLVGATVQAVHVPSGTRYGVLTRGDGRFLIPGMRVGGPYTVTVNFIGFETATREGVQLNLGVATDMQFTLRETAIGLEEVRVTAERDATFSPDRTGAATSVQREQLETLPTVNRRIQDFTRLTPQAGQGLSFAGQDNRLNNITVDGAFFNNSFGLSGQPGGRTNVSPISIDAIEQIQVNVAPFDVRQGNFVGAAVNTVTRSGTNDFRGALRYDFRNQNFVGTETLDRPFEVGTFDFRNVGGWVSGPIIRDRLFFFFNAEDDIDTRPATNWRANRGGETPGNNITRVLESDLLRLQGFLRDSLSYDPGGFQGYPEETPARRFLARVDFNANQSNRFSLRYTHLDSSTDILLSQSASLGQGTRRTNAFGLNFSGANYSILENIRSLVGEWNSQLSPTWSNNMIVGYTTNDESRGSPGALFPFVDILQENSVYTSFGTEPFTPANQLRYNTLQFQNNLTRFGARHTQTFGASLQRYRSENVFFPGSQSVYVYNSLEDFFTDARDHIRNPNRTTSPVTLNRFQLRWMNIPGLEEPLQPLEVFYGGLYAQNEWRPTTSFALTVGARVDVPFFRQTGFRNDRADALTFRDETGAAVQYQTDKLPDANPLFSPRLGFNWDVLGDRSTQFRGGTGIFTGTPAFVWISNQIGNTGVLTGFENLTNTTARPFNPNPQHFAPSDVTGAPAAAYELALTDPNFRFPQLWRSNFAVDQRLPFGMVATAEFLYGRDVNGVYYINANLPGANAQFQGADARPRWTGPTCAVQTVAGVRTTNSPCITRINNQLGNQVENAIVLKNQNEGSSWNLAGTLRLPEIAGFSGTVAYSYGEARNTVDPGSIAFGSWNGNPHAGDPNNPGLGFSANSPGHRVFAAVSGRREWFRFGATRFGLFWEGITSGNASYVFAGDLNGDGGTANDLIYIHRDISEMNFQQYTVGSGANARTFTAQEQAEAWNRFIQQDRYLSRNRGSYVERGAVFLPMRYRADLSISQELFTNIAGRRNGLEISANILNVTNLLNQNWGAGYSFVTTQPLLVPTAAQGGPVDAQGRAQYRLRNIGGELITESFQRSSNLNDVYQVQIGLRYTFN